MRRQTSSWICCLAVLAACTFQGQNNATGDGSIDAPVAQPVVGFDADMTSADHTSGTIMIAVSVTGDVSTPVSVSFRVANQSTAVLGTDYTVTESTLTFTSASTLNIPVTILPEMTARLDGTAVLELFSPVGATLGRSLHTIDISANVLPKVSFHVTSSQVTEGTAQAMIEVDLDKLSNVPATVMFTVTGSAANPADYTIDASPIMFAANEMSKVIAVTIVDDTLSEDDEDVVVTITSASAATLGTNLVHTLTIHDNNDPEPTVFFSTDVESSPEATATVTLTVNLSGPSGKTITVPFAAAPGLVPATDPDDYSYGSTLPLTFAPGSALSQTITIAVVNDTIDEPDETVTTVLQTPTNANLSLTNPTTNTLTIVDDDLACFGPAGSFQVCFDRGPTAPPTTNPLPATLNTDTSGLCEATQPPNWAAQGQPPACFILGTTITVNTTVVTGTRPLVLVSSGTLTVSGLLDASSGRASGNVGPGSPSGFCGTAGAGVQSSGTGGGGGAGGSFMSVGGNGGTGDAGAKNGGTAAAKDGANPTVLRGGCDGAKGGRDGGTQAGNAGLGGGVVYLIAGTTLTLGASASINASGEGAAGGGNFTGGSGAGSGGMIYLFGGAITATNTTKVFANGGGGSGGGNNSSGGTNGGDPLGGSVTTPATGGGGGGAAGGVGFAGATVAGFGGNGTSNKAGGGGGGGGGFIESNVSLGSAKTSAGKIAVP